MTTLTPDTLLMRYAAGVLPPYESMLMAAYLTVSDHARKQMAAFEAAGGRMIENAEPVSVTQTCLNNILALTHAPEDTPRAHAAPDAAQPASDEVIPVLLRKLVAAHCPQQKLNWERVTPGIAKIDISLCRSEPRARRLRLLRLAPYQATPQHHHSGTEITLVLDGSFSDETGHYQRGDLIVIDDPGLHHSPRANALGCLCLTLTEAPLRFDSLFMQMFAVWRRI